jgi:beta-lactamase regulating signal transducer with metallopeptidase domain
MLQSAADMLLQNAIGVVPIALVVAVLCKTLRLRPATRHTLWLGVLLFLIIPPTLPEFSRSLLRAASPISETSVSGGPIEPHATPAILPSGAPIETTTPGVTEHPKRPSAGERPVGNPPVDRADRLSQRREPLQPIAKQIVPLTIWSPPIVQSPALQSFPRPEWSPIDRRAAGQPVAERAPSSPAHPSIFELQAPDPIVAERGESPGIVETIGVFWRSGRLIAGKKFERAQDSVTAGFVRVRSAASTLPTVPAWLWFGGVLAVLTIAIVRLCLAFRLFRSAERAPQSVRALVESAAVDLGVRRAPRTLMVADRVSPMVWCGWRTTLVLPETLWSELDDAGRRAVVQHELAHIRRRDHWVRWAELLISTLYWWHPVVWWARRRVREEADLSCDLWVTALLPGARAPYARALLMTKQYVSAGGSGVPSVGIGAVSPGARRFSRRITMVMTTRMNPKNSIVGVALAASLVLGGVYSAPGWACPTPEAPAPAAAPSAPSEPTDLSTFEQYMIDRTPAPISSTGSSCDEAAPTADAETCRSTKVASTLGSINGRLQSLVGGQLGYPGLASVYAVGDTNERTVTYHLPMDRLRGLTRLMAREDVPLLVEAIDDGIIVHGNDEQQRRFAAFVAILDPREELVTYRLNNEGILGDLTKLMALDSVPTLINIGDDALVVHGNANTQRAFAEFIGMIAPGSAVVPNAGDRPDNPMVHQRSIEHPLRSEAAKVELRVRGMFEEARRLREMEAMLLDRADMIEDQADQIEDQSDLQREQAEAMLDAIESLLESADGLSSAAQYEAMVEAEKAQREASLMMHLAEVFESQIEQVQTQAESLASQAMAFGEQAEALEAEAESLAESLESQLDDLEAQLEDRLDQFNDWAHEHAESLQTLLQEHAERLDEELSQRFGHGAR